MHLGGEVGFLLIGAVFPVLRGEAGQSPFSVQFGTTVLGAGAADTSAVGCRATR
jgi:hypothetical protein